MASPPPWSDLPVDLLLVIFQNLKENLVDILSSARVCLSWNSVIQTHHSLLTSSPLIAYRSLNTLNQEILCFFNTQTELLLPELRGRWFCCYGHNGWLLTINLKSPDDIQLLNPITGVRVNLPPTRKELNKIKKMRIVMSTNHPSDPNCIILASHVFVEDLCFCKPGDLNWTSIDYYGQGVHVKDAIFYKGEFYILASCTLKFPQTELIYRIRMNPNGYSRSVLEPFVGIPEPDFNIFRFNYFVEMMGELLLVSRYTHRSYSIIRMDCESFYYNGVNITEDFKVHKLEWKDGEGRWAEVKRLEKNAIYLARFSSMSMPVSSSSGPNQRESCIYFLDDYVIEVSDDRFHGCDSGLYDMEDKRFSHLSLNSSLTIDSPLTWYF